MGSTGKRKPSVIRVIYTDTFSLIVALIPIIMWVICLLLPPTDDVYLATAFTIMATPALLWRVWYIRRLFSHGVEVTGMVSLLSFARGRGCIEYDYRYRGLDYHGCSAIQHTPAARKLKPGQLVTVHFRPDKPAVAAIGQL